MKKVGLLGAGGYIAPTHMKAIRDNGLDLVVACDPNDSVGVLDRYFPECIFVREPEIFWLYVRNSDVDVVVICTPNYLHVPQAILALGMCKDVILEKPAALTNLGVEQLLNEEAMSVGQVYCISQLRLHPEILHYTVDPSRRAKVFIDYNAPRGPWYEQSWKGDKSKSGGLLFNIGIHLFDLTTYLFGNLTNWQPVVKMAGGLRGRYSLTYADVEFDLSTGRSTPVRNMFIDDKLINLSSHITSLHYQSYYDILNGKGFGLQSIKEGIKICGTLSQ